MKITTILIQSSFLTVGFISVAPTEPLSMWAVEAGDNRQNRAGYEMAPGVETLPVYLAMPEDGAYHHHPFLLVHDGVFFAAFSECRSGEDGRHFSIPVQTDIPDSPSKTTAGTLPDGRNFIIGNFVHDPERDATRKHYKRYPLVLALSIEGKVFDRAYAIRAEPTEPRFEVGGSSDGYQYPDAIVVGDDLWVIYSINKQDIAISRIAWKDL